MIGSLSELANLSLSDPLEEERESRGLHTHYKNEKSFLFEDVLISSTFTNFVALQEAKTHVHLHFVVFREHV